MAETKKRVYRFGGKTAEGDGSMRELLGGKGANLAEMSKLGMPVPAGFTITTECCFPRSRESFSKSGIRISTMWMPNCCCRM